MPLGPANIGLHQIAETESDYRTIGNRKTSKHTTTNAKEMDKKDYKQCYHYTKEKTGTENIQYTFKIWEGRNLEISKKLNSSTLANQRRYILQNQV